MTKRKSDFTLPTLDDLFTTQEERDDAKLERVNNIPLDELHPFKNHPFKILNNEEMERMIESIRKVGTITPALARPLPDGGLRFFRKSLARYFSFFFTYILYHEFSEFPNFDPCQILCVHRVYIVKPSPCRGG